MKESVKIVLISAIISVLKLVFLSSSLKILFITGNWNNLNDNDTENWKNYINSFQVEKSNYPINSFIDKNYLNFFQENKLNFFAI